MIMRREELIGNLGRSCIWDIIVIGGGATGLGCAVDAAGRGYQTLLLEQYDFAKGTSGRSTKLVHGGVRYLKQGDIFLVTEALHERGLLLQNAPHLVRKQAFVIPIYRWFDLPFYLTGLKFYDLLAGKRSFGSSRRLSRRETLNALPAIRPEGLHGGVCYYDGRFDDARLAINLAQTCVDQGGCPLNYVRVDGLAKSSDGRLTEITATDRETQKTYRLKTRAVINCTGVFADDVLRMDDPKTPIRIKPSQGIHLVLDKAFLGGDAGIMIPKTTDGRVLFVLPWGNKVLMGTTDTELNTISLEPEALPEEVNFILNTAAAYLQRPPSRRDIQCIYAGLRPLAAPQNGAKKTKEISRSHKIIVSPSGLITVLGGKWTTYRKMAQDAVDKAISVANLKSAPCRTKDLKIHGWSEGVDFNSHWHVYGSDKAGIEKLIQENPDLSRPLHPDLPFTKAEVVWSVRHEMARTVEDILARRQRVLFLNAQISMDIATDIANLMAAELGRSSDWVRTQVEDYVKLVSIYL
ncbi:MAG: glycerol-3-phosphate dehydrogenase/oxidase [Sedimentisphaerales bacterium]|nr:glycerol-3-phosphate dehydrogenase/oxidase [Sedimentisphaerales bacterium]